MNFLKDTKKVAFVPFAAVSFSFENYLSKVREVFGSDLEINSIHSTGDPHSVIEASDAIMVGGGNTFALLKRLKDFGLVDLIKQKVETGTPYVGWSAGSNLAGPTICTTNDMPIVDPGNFESFGFVPFQINPHYVSTNPKDHMGETRDQRIQEFIDYNQGTAVVAIPEGTYLLRDAGGMKYYGGRPGKLFRHGMEVEEFDNTVDLGFLIR